MFTETGELETQKQIYILIQKEPGLNLTKVAELLKISVELARYHLQYLEKNELISSEKEEGFHRYYLKGEIGIKDKKFLSLFRQEMLLKIVLFLLKNPNSRHKDILEQLDMKTRSLLSYYLQKLMKKGIVEAQGEGIERRYAVIHEEEIIRFLIKYEPYKVVEGITETWMNFTIK
jgi:predicted transcriptional regulator